MKIQFSEADAQRFWSKVLKTDSCWLWTEAKVGSYGSFSLNCRSMPAHRFSYIMANGDISDSLLVCHKCDIPACVRPDHLFLGTQQDNMQDMVQKGRAKRGERRHQYRTYLHIDKATGNPYAIIRVRQKNGKYQKRIRRIQHESEAHAVAMQLKKEFPSEYKAPIRYR